MPDTYGALQIPVQVPDGTDAAADPALSRLGEYLQAVLNHYGQAVFNRLGFVAVKGVPVPVVRTIWTHDPNEYVFSEAHLPALYITRTGGDKPVWTAEDYRIQADKWNALWIFPPGVQANQRTRDSITNAIGKLIDAAIERVRDPVWAWALDPDTKAASVVADPVAIRLASASSTSAKHYSASSQDGSLNTAPFAPSRHPTVTVAGTVADVLAGSIVTVTGFGADGTARESLITLSATAGRYDGDWMLTQVTSIDVPAQLGTGATFTFGIDAYTGRGTSILNATGLQDIEVAGWSDKMVALKMSAGLDVRTYDAVEIKIATQERWIQDTSLLDDQGLDAAIPYSDGAGILERMTLP